MITAEELLDNIEIWDGIFVHSKNAREAMIEFAKLHVEAALKEAKWRYDDTTNSEGLGEYVLNSYPESNIV